MLTFMRNKLISVYVRDESTLRVHGVLDDDIYGMELTLSFDIPHLRITAIEGKWNRWTTPECPRAIPPLQGAVGLTMEDAEFSQKVNKLVSRRSCRHFANLLLECCHTAREAALGTGLDQAEKEGGDRRDVRAHRTGFGEEEPSLLTDYDRERDEGIVIDLHVHTSPASPCSSAPVDELIQEAMRIGLDGICLTDHNHLWPPGMIEDLRHRHGFLVLGGNEVTTAQGDMLVFGLERNIEDIITVEALREEVDKVNGFIIAAHPFRGFLLFGVDQLGLTVEAAMKRPHFARVDALEVLNSKVTDEENAFALKVARGLGLPVTGGSDAHEVEEVGIYATRFSSGIENERDLIGALKQGNYEPVIFRKGMKRKEG